ncbi:glutactin-like [Contarinia nasturtii]|uniref:glutactin-like n=1 Tax=Contarinia nasturtii TaxID=265458 RepID=UPI0012D390EC|nr:glutactin-like [Contarinia nasturtii]
MNGFDQVILSLVTFLGLSAQMNIQPNDPIVRIPHLGWLKGKTASTKWTNRTIYEFLGVPYAEAPSGKRRFKPPVAKKPWLIRDAVEMGQSCPQGERQTSYQPSIDVEDCLNMNIFTPKIPSNTRASIIQHPVIVYIHGGTFATGSNAEYPPSYLLEHDIVLVVPNYRLNALGFLSTKTAEIPGNAGALDILLALKWVKQNIKYFGGNSKQITVIGQSSGACMASSLLVSPLVPNNLFQQMIIHSGSVFAPWSFALDPVSYAKDIAHRANVPKNASLHEINKAFMKMDAFDLIEATNEHYSAERIRGSNRVGGQSLTVGGPTNFFLPFSPEELLRKGFYKKNVRLIAGVVQNEGSFLTRILYDQLNSLSLSNKAWLMKNKFISATVNALGVPDDKQKVLNLVKNIFAVQIKNDNFHFRSYAPGFSELSGTVGFKNPVLQLAQVNWLFMSNRTYLYSFDYRGAYSRFGYEEDISQYPFDGGVSHSDDLIYLFPYPDKVAHLNAADTEMARNMVDLWASFAETGTPQFKTSTLRWPSMTSFWGPYLHINETFNVGTLFTDEFSTELENSHEYSKVLNDDWVANLTRYLH